MRRTRVIPVLLIHNGGVVKTTRFKDPVYIGDPINAIRIFNDLEVDEIIVIDIDATKYNREPDYTMIQDLASEAFMPFAYGGGIKTVEAARKILRSGIEKIVVNQVVQDNPGLVRECKEKFGSQSVIVSIDYKKKLISGNLQYDYISDKTKSVNVIDAAISAEKLGAGEVFLNSVDRDGMMNGLDIETVKLVSGSINVPLIICGGAGDLSQLSAAEEAGANAIAAGSLFVFHGKQRGVLINYPNESKLRQYLK